MFYYFKKKYFLFFITLVLPITLKAQPKHNGFIYMPSNITPRSSNFLYKVQIAERKKISGYFIRVEAKNGREINVFYTCAKSRFSKLNLDSMIKQLERNKPNSWDFKYFPIINVFPESVIDTSGKELYWNCTADYGIFPRIKQKKINENYKCKYSYVRDLPIVEVELLIKDLNQHNGKNKLQDGNVDFPITPYYMFFEPEKEKIKFYLYDCEAKR